MKRSEMLNVIEHILYWSDSKDLKKQALSVLEHIENHGMLPPIHYPYSCGCSMRGSCPTCTPNEYKMYNKWEQENE